MARNENTPKHVTYATDYVPTNHHKGSKVFVCIDEIGPDKDYKYPNGGFWASVHTIGKFGTLSTQAHVLADGETFDECVKAAKRAFPRFFGCKVELGEIVLDGVQLINHTFEPCFFYDKNDATVNERFCEWAKALFAN